MGHQGYEQTMELLRSHVYGEVKDYIDSYERCTMDCAPVIHTTSGHLLASHPTEILAIHFTKTETTSDGKEDVLELTDVFTKFSLAIPTSNQEAVTVAKVLVRKWFQHYRVPQRIHSDQGWNFESKLVLALCELYSIRKKSVKLLISSLNALVQSAGFSQKTQPRLLLLPISSHGLTTATVSAWVHLILSSNLSRKFRTLLQDLFSWHPITTTQHLLEKLHWLPISERIKYKVACMCFSAIVVLVLLISLNCCMSTLRLVNYALLLTPACWEIQQYKRKTHGFCTFSCFGPHIWNSLPQDLRHCSTLSSSKAKLKTFLFSQYFHPN